GEEQPFHRTPPRVSEGRPPTSYRHHAEKRTRVPNGSRTSEPRVELSTGTLAAFSRTKAASRCAASAASIANHERPARSSSRLPAPAECQVLLPMWWW